MLFFPRCVGIFCFLIPEMNATSSIRVRFAPSPTGYLHVGGLRTAFYNYLFARKHNGTFVLRIEDTDRTRYVEGAVENLIETLKWTELEFDEGPGKEGKHGPYIQSQRLDIYRKHAGILLEKKKTYRCFCTPERLEEMRKQQEKMKVPPKYDRHCLRLSEDEVQKNLKERIQFVVRMKIPEGTMITFDDVIREKVEFDSDRIDDQILLKSDGYPTYHLANVVDDHLMEISHVIRGEEWLSSTPKHVLLYQYFGWEIPVFAHLPLLLNPDKSKLSKRQGDVAVEDYRAKGYLPEALINFVALLGWNPGDNREVFRMEELVKEFSLERVGKSGAVFNLEKLNWINQQHLRQLDEKKLVARIQEQLRKSGFDYSDEYVGRVVHLMKERVTTIHDFVTLGSYFFTDEITYDEKARSKNWNVDSPKHISALVATLEKTDGFTHTIAEELVRKVADEFQVNAGKIIHAVRLAVTGRSVGPGLFELMDVLGKERVIRRLKTALTELS